MSVTSSCSTKRAASSIIRSCSVRRSTGRHGTSSPGATSEPALTEHRKSATISVVRRYAASGKTGRNPRMTEQEPRTFTRADWVLIGVLLALVLPLRLWLLHNTEVTARDSIGYIRYALQFERKPWQDVCEKNHQHPGYPICVYLMSLPIRAFEGKTTPENMELSAQLVSLFASLLLMLPMYLLGRQFFDRTV